MNKKQLLRYIRSEEFGEDVTNEDRYEIILTLCAFSHELHETIESVIQDYEALELARNEFPYVC